MIFLIPNVKKTCENGNKNMYLSEKGSKNAKNFPKQILTFFFISKKTTT